MKVKFKSAISLLVALTVSFPSISFAEKTYTPSELRSMVGSGNPPKQGEAVSQSQSMEYVACLQKILSVIESVKDNYPTQTVLSTNIARIENLWTNDSAMTLTCSAPDKKLVITTAPYI